MKIKKILASVAAGALAVSTLAASAFAATVDFGNKEVTQHNAIVTIKGYRGTINSVPSPGQENTIAIDLGDTKGEVVSVQLKGIANNSTNPDKPNDKEFSLNWNKVEDNTVTFQALTGKISALDVEDKVQYIQEVVDGAKFKADITVVIQNEEDKGEYKSADKLEGIKINSEDVEASIEARADTTRNATLEEKDGATVKPSNDNWKEFNDSAFTVEVTFKDAAKDIQILTASFKDTDDKTVTANAVIEKDAKTAKFSFPASKTYVAGKIDAEAGTITPAKYAGSITIAATGLTVTGVVMSNGAAPAETTPAEVTTATEAPATSAPAATEAPATSAAATEAPTTTAATTANGSNGGDNNPNSGFVFAIVPAAVAAAGVVIAKKRK